MKWWCVQINVRQYNLDKDKDEAHVRLTFPFRELAAHILARMLKPTAQESLGFGP